MSDLLGIAKEVFSQVIAIRRTEAQSAKEYLREIIDACESLVKIADISGDEAKLLHEKIKVFYDSASQRLKKHLDGGDETILFQGLSSARIYYWARVLGGLSQKNKDLGKLLEDRDALPPSLNTLYSLKRGNPDKIGIEDIRTRCLHDIARLKTLHF